MKMIDAINMSCEEMLALVNKATVNAKLSDDTTKTLNVIWNEVVNENGIYTLKGYANATMQGVLTTIKGEEIEVTLNVETKEDPNPSVEPSEEPSVEPSVEPSSEPSSEVSETPSSSETTNSSADNTSSNDEKPTENKKGCRGSVATPLMGLLACALLLKKKRK